MGDNWSVEVTPNDGTEDGATVLSENLTIINAAPSISALVLNSSLGTNLTTENLTRFVTATDADGDAIYNITNWYQNTSSITNLNMPFENHSNASTITIDYSGGSFNGTIVGSPTFFCNGRT